MLDHSSTWFAPRFSAEVIGLGTTLMQMKSDGWAQIEVTDDDAPINTVLSLADVDLVGTAAGVFTVARNKVKSVMDDVPIVSLQKLGRRIFALSADGMMWESKK
jgi:predicted transcriptional regulator